MNKIELLEHLYSNIIKIRKKIKNRCIIIGIEGRDCSGKTTFSKKLRDFLSTHDLETSIVSIDDFCNKREIRYSGDLKNYEQFYYNNFDYMKFKNRILEESKKNGSLFFSDLVLNTKSNKFDKKLCINISNKGILLIEGIFIYKNEFKEFYDLSIRFEIDEKEQLKRAERRDLHTDSSKAVLDKYLNRYIPGHKLYESINNPFEFADIVIDNTSYEEPFILKHHLDND